MPEAQVRRSHRAPLGQTDVAEEMVRKGVQGRLVPAPAGCGAVLAPRENS
jgi:hypothetical protein